MRIQTTQDELKKLLTTVVPVTEKPGRGLPICSCVLIANDAITGTNLDIFAVTEIETFGDPVAVPAKRLLDIVKALPKGDVTLTTQGEKFRVQSGAVKVDMDTEPAEDFPAIPEVEGEEIGIEADALTELVRGTAYAVSKDETRPALGGVKITGTGSTVTMTATDGHRLSRVRREAGRASEFETLVYAAGLLHVLRTVKDAARFTIGEHCIKFTSGPTTTYIRTVDGRYPDVDKVIPEKTPEPVDIWRTDLRDAVKLAGVSADKVTQSVVFALEPGRLLLLSENEEDRAVVSVDVDYDGEAVKASMNKNYVEDFLKNSRADTVQLAITDGDSPVVFGPDLYLVMPFRLN